MVQMNQKRNHRALPLFKLITVQQSCCRRLSLTATRVLEAPICLCMSEVALVLVRFRVQAGAASAVAGRGSAVAAAAGSGNTMEQS